MTFTAYLIKTTYEDGTSSIGIFSEEYPTIIPHSAVVKREVLATRRGRNYSVAQKALNKKIGEYS